MSYILKIKFLIVLFSFSVLAFIQVRENNFFAPKNFNDWKQLTWEDFQGYPNLFTKYDASIRSDIYLKFDSTTSIYIAFASQNVNKSWKKEYDSDYLLEHEQYHFNITELHARMMNKYIQDNPKLSEEDYLEKLIDIQNDLDKMQNNYDTEANHSLITDQQYYWEYKVDSLLLEYSQDSGYVVDPFTGLKAFFPTKPALKSVIRNDHTSVRVYSREKYGITLASASYDTRYLYGIDLVENFDQGINRLVNQDSTNLLLSYNIDNFDSIKIANIVQHDTVYNTRSYKKWIFNEVYLYQVLAVIPFDSTSNGYDKIANSFINSFDIVNTDDYWIEKFNAAKFDLEQQIQPHKFSLYETKEELGGDGLCTYWNNDTYSSVGIYKSPITNSDGSLFLALDLSHTPDSIDIQTVMVLNDEIYNSQPDTNYHIFYIPAEKIPANKNFTIDFGYIPNNDSVNGCLNVHYQEIEILRD
ncbi:hypothetical protein [Chondrinema litorale]|uniref:hypothetical protein n=1 Tax=Chondrinema litorale TaxID=2994555 RepID=UPI0025429FE2|nr:hypothetical protein [Chondrinema litorale]UZR93254.1 hypothetical protein OQ292_15460 [Chondrinema litorale]